MFCSKCGAQISEGAAFCSACGASAAQTQPPAYTYGQPYGGAPYSNVSYRQKSTGLAVLLGILFPGAGHLYAGKIVRGIVFIVAFFSLSVLTYVGWWFLLSGFDGSVPFTFTTGIIVFTVVMAIVILVIWVYQLIDAYNVTKRFNAELMATGREPW